MKTPNAGLARCLERSGMRRKELARRVNAAAQTWGQPHITPNASTVRRWLEGDRPRPPVPEILAHVFSARFGYRVTTYDLGFGEAGMAERALVYNASYVVTVEA